MDHVIPPPWGPGHCTHMAVQDVRRLVEQETGKHGRMKMISEAIELTIAITVKDPGCRLYDF